MCFLSFVFSLLLLLLACLWDVRVGFWVSCDCLFVCRVCCSRSRFRREVVSLEIPIFTYLVLFFPGVGNVAGWRVPESLKSRLLRNFGKHNPNRRPTNHDFCQPSSAISNARAPSIHQHTYSTRSSYLTFTNQTPPPPIRKKSKQAKNVSSPLPTHQRRRRLRSRISRSLRFSERNYRSARHC